MIKKIGKFVGISFILVVLLAVTAFFVLKHVYSTSKLQTLAKNYVAEKLHREITFDNVSFTWIGFTLTNVALSENSTFAEGTFLQAKNLTAHLAVKPLLQKRFEISRIEADGLDVNIIARKDGTFNFDSLLPKQEESQSIAPTNPTNQENAVKDPLVITADLISLNDCNLVYKNEQTNLRTSLNNLSFQIHNFDLNTPFDTTLSLTTDISGTGQPDLSLPISLQFQTFLAGLDLSKAYANITKGSFQYKTVQLDVTGNITNFKNPAVDLNGQLAGITNTVLGDFAPGLPSFSLPKIPLFLKANLDLDNSQATIEQAKLSVQDSALTAAGKIRWDGPTPTYQLTGSLNAVLGQLVQMTNTLDDFNPAGTLKGTFKATEQQNYTDIHGSLVLQDVNVLYDPYVLTQLNGTILFKTLQDISSNSLTGKLNGENFAGSFSYKTLKNLTDLMLNLNLDKLTLTRFTAEKETSSTSTTADTTTDTDTASSTPMNIRANLTIGDISIPYFQSKGLTLAANLTNVTNSFAHTDGTINFAFQPGKITNLDDFIKDNKTAKILLLPVSIIKKVADKLKMDLFSTDKAQGTSLAFTEGAGDYTFTDGVMNINQTIFNSTLTRISANGTANFQTEALNMKATATLLTEAAPIAIKITGTLSEPKGKLDVVNTVTSVVGGILNGTVAKAAAQDTAALGQETAQTATQTVKDSVTAAQDLVKGIGSLFKKNTPAEEK